MSATALALLSAKERIMEKAVSPKESHYSLVVGLIYAFNLMAGTGALAIPKAFQDAGYGLGLAILVVLGFLSYISATFVLESMSSANAIFKSANGRKFKTFSRRSRQKFRVSESTDDSERERLLTASEEHSRAQFEITQRAELGQMASMFLNTYAVWFFYACIGLYLFGDLAIYAAVVPKSLARVICTYVPESFANQTCLINFTLPNDIRCWEDFPLSRMNVYRICVVLFGALLGPFIFANVTKTKYLQVFTTSTRWFSFALMLALATVRLLNVGPTVMPSAAKLSSFGALFGASVYSFMNQHSLPSLITPVRSKRNIFRGLILVYLLVFLVLASLSLTAIFTFPTVMDVYTLNFYQPHCHSEAHSSSAIAGIPFFGYFLALFPVFTLSTNFPVLGITLRNNIRKAIYPADADYSLVSKSRRKTALSVSNGYLIDASSMAERPGSPPLLRSIMRYGSMEQQPQQDAAPVSEGVRYSSSPSRPSLPRTRSVRIVTSPGLAALHQRSASVVEDDDLMDGNPNEVDYVDAEPEPDVIRNVRRQWWIEKAVVPLAVVIFPVVVALCFLGALLEEYRDAMLQNDKLRFSKGMVLSLFPMRGVEINWPNYILGEADFLSYFLDDVEILVSFTGSYAGAGLQYVMPALLVWAIRFRHSDIPIAPSGFASPFQHAAWIWLLFAWAIFTVVIVTVNIVMQKLGV